MGGAGRAGGRLGRPVLVRAQDRRCRRRADLRGRRAHEGRDPRRWPDRRGHHGQRSNRPERAPAAPARGSARVPRGSRRDLPAGEGVRTVERGAAGRREASVREPPQCRGGLAPPEGPEGHRLPSARPARALVRVRGRRPLRFALGVPRLVPRCPAAGGAHLRGQGRHRRGRGLPRALGGRPAQRRLGGRRGGRQGRQGRAPAGARRDEPRAAVGDRLQVPARGTHGAAEEDRCPHRPDGEGHAVRRARTGLRGRRDDHLRDAAQRGRGRPQGRARGRRGHRSARRRRDPRDRRAGAVQTQEGRPEVEVPDDVSLVRDRARPGARRGRSPVPEPELPQSEHRVAVLVRLARWSGHRGARLHDRHGACSTAGS